MNSINWVYEKKLNHIQFNFEYKNVKYLIKGRTLYKNKMLNLTFGYYGDDFPCIMLDYDTFKKVFKVYKLRALPFGSSKDTEMATCLKPALPLKGALDILVMFSLAVAEVINPEALVVINDDATVDDNKSLSWLKYFAKSETAYSKYGFIRRDTSLKIQDSESYKVFKYYMNNSLPKNLQYKLNEVLSDKVIYELEKKYEEFNIEFKKKKIKMIKFSKKNTLEKVILDWVETEKLQEILNIIKKNIDIDLRGYWYLSWYYYNNNIKEKVYITKIQKL
jgi:hypothetical protein